MMMRNKVKSLYIHIPFCEHLCDYCDFPKLQYFRNFAKDYLVALKKELDSYHIDKNDIQTIYVGGGTPTALEDDLFLELLKIIKPYSEGVKEYTFEANPESLSKEKLQMMKEYHVNRLSIGVESTNDDVLKAINRHHTFKDVQTAVLNARNLGFDNINVDLIIGLPQVSKSLLIKDLDNVLTLNVDHISCYSLSVHPNTVFGIKKIEEPSGDLARDYYDIVEDKLLKNGFIHYEISNWCKPGKESLHNFTYWKDEQYYGIGLGASGYIDDIRYTNTRNIQKYNSGEFLEEKEAVNKEDDILYFIMLNLRTNRGIYFKEFEDRFGVSFKERYQEKLKELVKNELIVFDEKNSRIYPTYNGMMLLDQIILALVGE